MCRVTIFTPVYNRVGLIGRVYESLLRQSCADFEWVVVDDGSTDGSWDVIKGYEQEGRLNMRCVRQQNGGKHRAINHGAKLAQGELFYIVDSDDWLPADSVESVLKIWEGVKEDSSFGGICGLDLYADGSVAGSGLPAEVIDTSAIGIRYEYGVLGDLKEVFRTSVLRTISFPEIDGERFCPEALVWNRIAKAGYKMRYVNKSIYFCEYQPGGLTDRITRIRMESPVASMMTYAELFEMPVPMKIRVRAAINYWRFAFCAKQRSVKISSWGNLFWLAGLLMHLRDKKNHGGR